MQLSYTSFVLIFQILAARQEDSGTYVCLARNAEGTKETRVEVIVEGGSRVPTAPRALVPEPLMVVVEGQTATLHCDAYGNIFLLKDALYNGDTTQSRCFLFFYIFSSLLFLFAGIPSPVITWTKLRSSLPWRHKVVNNSLVLPAVGRQDSGEYICSAKNTMGTSEVTLMLEVESECFLFLTFFHF